MYRIGKNSKMLPARKLLLFFLLGFFAGTAFAGLFGRNYMDYAGILSEYYLNRYQYTEILREPLFLYLVRERFLPVAVLALLGFTPLACAGVYGFFGWQGFSLGTVLTMSVWKFGGGGILLCLAGMLPQYVFYLPAWTLLGMFLCVQRGGGGDFLRLRGQGRPTVGNLVLFFLIFLLLVAGTAAEAWINPELVMKILPIL